MILFSQITNSQEINSEIIPTLNHDLSGKSLLYCPTFEISWINLKQTQFEGENVTIKHAPKYLHNLNDSKVDIKDYRFEETLIFSGIVNTKIADSLNNRREKDFPNIQTDFSDYIGDLISYAHIDLNLEYQTDFELIDHSLIFDNKKVKSFGVLYNPDYNLEIGKQISIIDYKDNDDFVVEIRLDNHDYELYLAKVPSMKNISEIYTYVKSRLVTGERDTLGFKDILQVPIIDLNANRNYSELINKNFKNQCCKELYFKSVFQSIKFKMDEKGVSLASDSAEAEYFSIPKHIMIFDKPFMILIRSTKSKTPLFVGWIENPEFMIKE